MYKVPGLSPACHASSLSIRLSLATVHPAFSSRRLASNQRPGQVLHLSENHGLSPFIAGVSYFATGPPPVSPGCHA